MSDNGPKLTQGQLDAATHAWSQPMLEPLNITRPTPPSRDDIVEALAAFSELASWYDALEDGELEVWQDFPHGHAPRGLLKLKHFQALSDLPPQDERGRIGTFVRERIIAALDGLDTEGNGIAWLRRKLLCIPYEIERGGHLTDQVPPPPEREG